MSLTIFLHSHEDLQYLLQMIRFGYNIMFTASNLIQWHYFKPTLRTVAIFDSYSWGRRLVKSNSIHYLFYGQNNIVLYNIVLLHPCKV